MTASTEQLHQLLELVLTELDRKAIPVAYMQDIDRKGKAFIEQAARRAQVAPQGWELVPQKATDEMLQAAQKAWLADPLRSTTTLWVAMLAAAPQPPEAENHVSMDKMQANIMKMCYPLGKATVKQSLTVQLDDTNVVDIAQVVDFNNAAPVQMPEAACNPSMQPELATLAAPVQLPEAAGWVDDGGMLFWTEDTPPDGENIYTEHQVRQLLAAHGIK